MSAISQLARGLAASRILFGAAILAAPGTVAGVWVGPRRAARPEAAVLGRALGARDLLLGVASLRALMSDSPAAASAAMAACVVADGTDLVATLAARDRLPSGPAAFTALAAGGAVAVAAVALADARRQTTPHVASP